MLSGYHIIPFRNLCDQLSFNVKNVNKYALFYLLAHYYYILENVMSSLISAGIPGRQRYTIFLGLEVFQLYMERIGRDSKILIFCKKFTYVGE